MNTRIGRFLRRWKYTTTAVCLVIAGYLLCIFVWHTSWVSLAILTGLIVTSVVNAFRTRNDDGVRR